MNVSVLHQNERHTYIHWFKQRSWSSCKMTLGLTQSQLFQTKTTTIQKGDFVGILLIYGGDSPVPTKKITNFHQKSHRKSPITKRMLLFHEETNNMLGIV